MWFRREDAKLKGLRYYLSSQQEKISEIRDYWYLIRGSDPKTVRKCVKTPEYLALKEGLETLVEELEGEEE
jgi:ABC-type cobalamin transport system ATPase subunit